MLGCLVLLPLLRANHRSINTFGELFAIFYMPARYYKTNNVIDLVHLTPDSAQFCMWISRIILFCCSYTRSQCAFISFVFRRSVTIITAILKFKFRMEIFIVVGCFWLLLLCFVLLKHIDCFCAVCLVVFYLFSLITHLYVRSAATDWILFRELHCKRAIHIYLNVITVGICDPCVHFKRISVCNAQLALCALAWNRLREILK